MKRLSSIGMAIAAVLLSGATAQAGTFINSQVNPNLRTHPQNVSAVGGERPPIRVCVDVQANEPMAIQAEPAVRKVIATLNRFRSVGDHSYAFNPATDMPAGRLDFESVLLHEMLHSQGLAHPNLADESNLPPPLDQGTRSTAGANGTYEQNAGADGIDGSADDLRGDDVNLYWYQRGVNDPGVLPAVIDETTMATTLDFLPSAHRYAANANRQVLAALGHADAEAVMHQGARVDEVQRHLQHDDVATLRLAQAGLDGIQGTADDYRIRYVYTGREINPQGVDCQVAIRFDNNAALATTTTSAYQVVPNHIVIWYARMRINPAVNWYFSPAPNTQVNLSADAPAAGNAGAPYTVRVGVAKTVDNPIAGYPKGRVEVRDGERSDPGTAYCSIVLAGTPDEIGQCSLTPLRSGNRTLVADYLGYAGFDGGSASLPHAVGGTLHFSDVQGTPDPSAADAPVEFRWTLGAAAGEPVAAASGTVTVKEAADCASPPSPPGNQCTATLPANACSIRFAGIGARTLRLCYSGDGAFPAASADKAHSVVAARSTATTIVSHLPATSAAFEPIVVTVGVSEAPALGGHPAGTVDVRDGAAGDPLTASCTAQLLGISGETASCTLLPLRAGAKNLNASFPAQDAWAASSASAAAAVGSFAIVRNAPTVSRLGQGVSVVVNLDVAPYLAAPAATGTISVSDGVDQCQIVLPASECLWSGSTLGVRSLVASWPGDVNYAARSSAAVSQVVVDATYPQLLSAGRSSYADSDGSSSITRFALSADGRYLVFASDAARLVDGDSNGVRDIFLRDMRSGEVRRISTDAFGAQANGASADAAISGNGRYVSFSSLASNLVPGDTAGVRDLFVKDLVSGSIVRATLRADGSQSTTAEEFFGIGSSLSADGRFVAFVSAAELTPDDGNGQGITDIYVRDLVTGALEIVSSTSEDMQSDFRSLLPAISADGRYVSMNSQSSNFPGNTGTQPQIYVKDRLTRRLVQASTSAAGVTGNNFSSDSMLSADGRYVTFVSLARNLVSGPVSFDYDILVKDLQTGAIERQNQNSAGQLFARSATAPAISADGRYVVFTSLSYAPSSRVDVYRKDRVTQQLVALSVDTAGVPVVTGDSNNPAISADARSVAFQSAATNLVAGDGNGLTDIFVRDMQLSTTQRASAVTAGARADADSSEPAVSRDGRYVAFSSLAGNLVSGDGNSLRDIFVHDRNDASLLRISTDAAGVAGNAASDSASISADGNWIAFRSAASNLVAGDSNALADIFVRQRASGAIARVSTASGGAQNSGGALGPTSVSSDGNWVVFGASDGSLVSGDSNGVQDIFAKNRASDTTAPVSTDAAGVFGNGDSSQSVLSDNGTRVAFVSTATNFAADDANGASDIYVKTLVGGAIVRASSNAAGQPGNAASSQPAISADGRFVAFASAASNLVAGDTNGNVDIFLKNLDDGSIQRVNTTAASLQGSGGDCATPSLSSDARYIGFVCAQANLVAGDSNGVADAFVKDRQTGAIQRLSLSASGAQANAASTATAQAFSDNGILVFASAADNLVSGDTQRQADVFAQRYQSTPLIATTTLIGAHTPNPTPLGASYTVTATVTRSSGTAPISGTVTLGDGANFCSAALSGSGATATAQCALTATQLGTRALGASYSGDSNYAASGATAVNHAVIGARVPSAPRLIAASAGNASVTLAFAPPLDEGGSRVSGYRASCGANSQAGAATPISVTGLSNGIAVGCTVVAINASGDSAPSTLISATPATVPAAPAGTVATRGNAQVSLAFVAGNSGGSAILDYTAQCGGIHRSATASPIVIGTLANGNAVSCSVSARNAMGRGAASATVTATPATLPGAPTALTAQRANAAVTLNFAPPASNGGDAIVSYTGYCGAASATAAAPPLLVSGLSNGVAVTCTVVASNSVGAGAASAPSASVTPATVPDAPQLVAAAPVAGSARLVFSAPAQNGGASITGYGGSCSPGALSATGSTSPLLVPGLVDGTTYTCSVHAINGVGAGSASNSLNVTPRASVDLSIANSNGTGHVQGGRSTSYLIDVVNHSSSMVAAARVVNTPDTGLSEVSWICSAQGGGVCPPGGSGSGGIDALVDLPANATVSFLISGMVAALPEQDLSNTATVTAPSSVIDTNLANNTATDGPDAVVLFRNGFD